MRARALTSHSHRDTSRVGDRQHTCVDKPWSLVTRSQPEHAQICHCRSRSLLTSARARSIGLAQPAPHPARTEIPCDPCPSADDVSHFVPRCPHAEVAMRHGECSCRRDRHPVQALFSTFQILIVFSRDVSSASRVVTATARSCGADFLKILLVTCCSVTFDCSTLTSRGSLVAVILLLLSDPEGFGCLALSALSPPIVRSPSMGSSLLAGAASLVSVPWSVLVVALGRAPDADDPPYETRGCGVGSCPVSSAILF